MADDAFKLTEEDHAKISAWFNSKAKADPSCQVCGNKSWGALPYVFKKDYVKLDPNTFAPTRGLAQVIVECRNCANQISFSAFRAGIEVNNYDPSLIINDKIDSDDQ